MASEFYTISTDVTSGSVDVSTLRQEIIDDPVVPNSAYIIVRGALSVDDLEISFSTALNPTEKSALDTIVADHPQIIENSDAGTSSYAYDRPPTPSDDIDMGVQVGDVWIDSGENVYICKTNGPGIASWRFLSEGGSTANESPGRALLGGILDYPNAAGSSGSGDIQYSRIWLAAGDVIDRIEIFVDFGGAVSREVRCGIYDQEDHHAEDDPPYQRVAQTNSISTAGYDGTYLQIYLTDAATGGSGSPLSYTVSETGWYWLAIIANNTVCKYAVTDTFRADYLPVRRESATGTTLPAASGTLTNPVSSVILVSTVREGIA